ncbi:CD276 antigen-like [Solea senegalensis]|uniref:CD276 antigen-like n=1 Tax=Solea senegalensis TaxID=28829 RepID=A0AAV6T806_SOLSE|nr:CD276 antigen-like [Solea senegalensis]
MKHTSDDKMVGNSLALLLLLCSVWTFTRADHDVSCVFMTRCILPCRLQPGPETIIHWIHVSGGNAAVHSFYKDKDQFSRQNLRFKDRTSLFNNQIAKGNASLQLTSLQILDQGRYKCYTSTKPGVSKESFINVTVDAPVHKVNVVKEENVVTCSSEGIYPEPELTWSNLTQQHKPTVQQDYQLLYNISSSVTLTDTDDNLDYYSCSVTTHGGSSCKTTLFKTTYMNVSESENTVTCRAVNIKPLSHLTWTFNFSEIITKRHDDQYTVTQPWHQWVKDVSESGSLTLRDLSADQTGTYTCEVSGAQETFIYSTFLRIQTEHSPISTGNIAIAIVIPILVAICVTGVVLFVRHRRTRQNTDDVTIRETKGMELRPMMNGQNGS